MQKMSNREQPTVFLTLIVKLKGTPDSGGRLPSPKEPFAILK
jgi:hypothetical protein